MDKLIIEFSKYVLITLMVIYTLQSILIFAKRSEEAREFLFIRQNVVMFCLHFVAFMVLYLQMNQSQILFFYGEQALYLAATLIFFRHLYPKASKLAINNMCMLITIGFIMVTRLSYDQSVKQFQICVIGTVIALIVPWLISKLKFITKFAVVYAILGIGLLVAVAVMATVTNGAKLSLTIAGITLQPSEFVKIIYVFCIAGMLSKSTEFSQIVKTTILAAVHVLILVISTDLGSALIYFMTYLIMLYVATRDWKWLALGFGAFVVAAVAAYFLFAHVRVRVEIWKDPFSVYEGSGYQVAQALFAIAAGGWFGTGLYQGSPTEIPYVDQDFMFAAIAEEMGSIFCICTILICMSCFIMFVNIAMKMTKNFYRYVALGLACTYAIQVFLTIGGSMKMIPMTGVTLPFVSSGGSSMLKYTDHVLCDPGTLYTKEKTRMIHLKMKNIMKSRKTTDSTRRKGRDAQADPDEDYLDQDYDDYDNEEEERIRRIKNKVLVRVSYLMVALFLSMAGYLIYFNVVLRDDINNNQYNTKQSAYQEQIIRGNIYSADGNVLAQTDIAEDGTESRSYPYSNLFAHIVGYATNGKSGIESVHNYDLLSSHASILDQIRKEKLDTKVQGDSLVLTLNTQLQQVCYDALGDNKGAIVVLEPSTGKVLAMVSKPDFDPNTIEQDWDALINDDSNSSLFNRALQGQYPPGSTFKILTTLEYIREHPDDYQNFNYTCNGSISQRRCADHLLRRRSPWI